MKTVRIGSGAGFGGDRIDPAIDIMEYGDLDYIIFECRAERTISIAQKKKLENPELGYNDLFEYRFEKTGLELSEVRYDYIGFNSLYGDCISSKLSEAKPCEVRLRIAGRSQSKEMARRVGDEVEALYTNGPSGGGGVEKQIKDIISIASILVPTDHFNIQVGYAGGK